MEKRNIRLEGFNENNKKSACLFMSNNNDENKSLYYYLSKSQNFGKKGWSTYSICHSAFCYVKLCLVAEMK